MSKHSMRIGGTSRPSACCRPSSASHAALAPALGAQPLLVERQQRVALGQLEDAALLAALGRAQLHRPVAAAGERVRQRRGRVAAISRWTTSSAGIDVAAAVVLEHELLPHLRQLALGLVGEVERLAVGEHAVAHLEDLRVGVAAVDRHRDRVERAHRLARHAAALQQRAHRLQPVALERRLLELLLRRRRHACAPPGRARSRRSAR